jgi:hypothetical protein
MLLSSSSSSVVHSLFIISPIVAIPATNTQAQSSISFWLYSCRVGVTCFIPPPQARSSDSCSSSSAEFLKSFIRLRGLDLLEESLGR